MEQIIVLKKNKLLSDMEKKILIKIKKPHRLDQMVVAGFDLLGIFP